MILKNLGLKSQADVFLCRGQGGAVMAEFIIITSLVLIPLFYGITLIGKYVDNKQKLEMAARYANWERTVWYQEDPKIPGVLNVKSADKIGFEIQNRIFSDENAGVYLAQNNSSTSETVDPMSKLYWIKGAKKQQSIYKTQDNSKAFITTTEAQASRAYGVSAGVLGGFFNLLGKVSSYDMNLGGAYTSTVKVAMETPLHFDNLLANNIALTRDNTILTDGWNAAGPAHAKKRVKGTVILDLFDVGLINTVRNLLAFTPIAKELATDKLIFGHVSVDAVPKVRLAPYK